MKIQTARELRESSKEKKPFLGKRILLAEDHRMNREIFSKLLEWYGFSVEKAENGQVAVDKLKEAYPDEYDMVLMDLGMPVLDGYRATRMIRELLDGRFKYLPIVALSGCALEDEIRKAMDSGMNAYLLKPFDENEMLEVFGKVLDDESRGRRNGH